ncbi:hypothetical protein CVT25_011652 [Psilocybe cyanescens]|uniref:Uncharacterized protein n=1 Tax=Psilocybe cyanescens TaxID=93625 RepID=A0A409WIP6_PSICY|nr:hypothetical protein CVT25_011652 [Psilocybe cyanescens]
MYRCTGAADGQSGHVGVELDPFPTDNSPRIAHSEAREAVIEVDSQHPPLATAKISTANIITQIFLPDRNPIPLTSVVAETTAQIVAQELLGVDIRNERSYNAITIIKHALDYHPPRSLPPPLRLLLTHHTHLSEPRLDVVLNTASILKIRILEELVGNDQPQSRVGVENIAEGELRSFFFSEETPQLTFTGYLRRLGRWLSGHAGEEGVRDLERGEEINQVDRLWLGGVVKGVVSEMRRICELDPPTTSESAVGVAGGGWMARLR